MNNEQFPQMSKIARAGSITCLIALYAVIGGSALYYIVG